MNLGGSGACSRAGIPVSNRLSRDQSAGPVRVTRTASSIGPLPTQANNLPPTLRARSNRAS